MAECLFGSGYAGLEAVFVAWNYPPLAAQQNLSPRPESYKLLAKITVDARGNTGAGRYVADVIRPER